MTIPALTHFPAALALARAGHSIRRRGWSPGVWLRWHGAQLREGGALIEHDRLTVGDYLAQDWTVYPTTPTADCLIVSPIDLTVICPYPAAVPPEAPACAGGVWDLPEGCALAGLVVTPDDCPPEFPESHLILPGTWGAARADGWFTVDTEATTIDLRPGERLTLLLKAGEAATGPGFAGAGVPSASSWTLRAAEGGVAVLFEVVDVRVVPGPDPRIEFRFRPAGLPPSWGYWRLDDSVAAPGIRAFRRVIAAAGITTARRYQFQVSLPEPAASVTRVSVHADFGSGLVPVWGGWIAEGSSSVTGACYLPPSLLVSFRAYAHAYPSTGPAWASVAVEVIAPAGTCPVSPPPPVCIGPGFRVVSDYRHFGTVGSFVAEGYAGDYVDTGLLTGGGDPIYGNGSRAWAWVGGVSQFYGSTTFAQVGIAGAFDGGAVDFRVAEGYVRHTVSNAVVAETERGPCDPVASGSGS